MGKRINTATWLPDYGRWQVKVQKDGTRRTFTSSTPGRTGQREANAKADAWLDDGIINQSRRVDALWADFMESLRLTTGTSYIKQTDCFGKYYILPIIGRLRISDLTAGKLQEVIDKSYRHGSLSKESKLQRGNLSRKTLQGIRSAELRFVKWCRKYKYTTLHPEDDVQIPRSARLKGKHILQPDALKVLFSADTRTVNGITEHDEFIFCYRFAVSTGLRPGEILGLRIKDVKNGTITVRGAVNRYEETTKGKNENALRTFVLCDAAQTAVQMQLMQLLALGEPTTPNAPLFTPVNQQQLYRRWKKYQESNGIEPPVSLYELRHTFVSIVQDVPDALLKPMVGHSKSMDTRGTYGHTVAGTEAPAAAAVTDAINAALK